MAISDTLSDIRKRLLDTGKTVQQLSTQQPTQTLYKQALANQPYSFWNGGNYYQGVDYTDDEKAKFKQAGALYNSGDVNGAMDIVNGISGTGRFGGFYDDDGQYWGFAQGYKGGANGSYQPVFGGTLISKGLDTTGTDIWLTPDKKAYSLGSGGTLTDTGRGWTQYRTNPDNMTLYDIAANAGVNYGDMLGEMLGNGELAAYNNDPTRKAKREAVYHNLLGNPNEPAAMTTLPDNPNEPATLTPYGFTPSTAPGAYDPNTNTIYLQWLNDYVNGGKSAPEWTGGSFDPTQNTMYEEFLQTYKDAKAPEWAGDPYAEKRDAALDAYGEKWQGSEYQPLRDEYLKKAAEMEFSFDPNTDPVWQALQKQYLREGRRATEDTLGRYAAMTGGMPSTAAVSAATQAGDYYAAQLSDRLPQVYQDAYNRYLQEYQKQLGISDAYAGFDDREYSRWLDQQGKDLDLAKIYNDLGVQDYNRYRDTRKDWLDERDWQYGLVGDNISMEQEAFDNRYKKYLDELDRFNADRDFMHDAAAENIKYNTDYNNEQYNRILDALEQANYEREQAENKRRWDLSYDEDKRRWDADFAADEAKTAYQREQDALQREAAQAKNATPASYAYSQDGSVYDFSSDLARDFVANAPKGTPGRPTTMRGGDGSIWRKDEYGNVTITKNGKTYYYGDQVAGQSVTPGKTPPKDPPKEPPEEPPAGGGKDNDNIETISGMISTIGFEGTISEILAYNVEARKNGWPVISQEEIMGALQLVQ